MRQKNGVSPSIIIAKMNLDWKTSLNLIFHWLFLVDIIPLIKMSASPEFDQLRVSHLIHMIVFTNFSNHHQESITAYIHT